MRPSTFCPFPGDVLALIASNLEQLTDRLRLEASCRTLLAASRGEHGGVYWGGARLLIGLGTEEAGELVGPFLAARRPAVAALTLEAIHDELPLDAPLLPSPPREL